MKIETGRTDQTVIGFGMCANPDKSVAVMVANKESAPKNLAICVDGAILGVTLPASSVATPRRRLGCRILLFYDHYETV